jgi:hypothetical protein
MLEALDAAARFYYANENVAIDILVNAATSHEIAANAPWVKNCYTVDVTSPNNLEHIFMQSWDFYIFPKRYKYTPQDYPTALLALNQTIITSYLKESVILYDEMSPNSTLQINEQVSYALIPKPASMTLVKEVIGSNNYLSILLFGASPQKIYPSNSLWVKVVQHILASYPYDIVLTGIKSGANGIRTKNLIEKLCQLSPRVKTFVDMGLQNQIALLQEAKLLISPHTGFGFLASMCDTPWLILSGGRWSDLSYAQTPYYSVFPKKKCYPCHGNMKAYCRLKLKAHTTIACFDIKAKQYIKEVQQGITFLLAPNCTFEKALLENKKNAEIKGLDISKNAFLRRELHRRKLI